MVQFFLHSAQLEAVESGELREALLGPSSITWISSGWHFRLIVQTKYRQTMERANLECSVINAVSSSVANEFGKDNSVRQVLRRIAQGSPQASVRRGRDLQPVRG